MRISRALLFATLLGLACTRTLCPSTDCDHLQASVDALQDRLTPCSGNAGIALVNFDKCPEAIDAKKCTTDDEDIFAAAALCLDQIGQCEPHHEDAWQSSVLDCEGKLDFISDACREALKP